MTSDYFHRVLHGFVYAWNGIRDLWNQEKNTRVHFFFTVAVIICGFIFRVSTTEWSFLIIAIGCVWSAEAMNSALERNVDLVTAEKKKLAEEAKDLAAGAVLIFAVMSAVIGLIIFLPKIISVFQF